jgi:hypothetical protein
MSAYAKLRRRRQIFVDAYVRTGDGSGAAIASGYSPKAPKVAASKMLANPEVRAAVAERTEEAIARAGVRNVQVLEEMARLAFASLANLRNADGNLHSFKDLPAELLQSATGIEFNPDGTIKTVRLAKVDGLRMLGQYLKLFTEVLQHQGVDGGPIQTQEVSDLEKARRIAHLLAQGLRARLPTSVLTESPGDETV